ncbi:MAG: type II toxin-antitoxin system VapC family toxin [Devosia sp.]|uniref:type II toxin-antitoxin system VapC family toxin n=1 Tax=Devosia sp. TaxID=1871048 RepID=UPI001AC138AE|nr:type II toxin-antitoxin system VapC family toxin [Devosia sp.]MBN9315817.1 type II toxin-antitoxin system VapC family toxin [Devosia sp.]
MFRFMLDTNIVSNVVRDPYGRASRTIDARGVDRVCTSVLVAAELRYGAAKSLSSRLPEMVDVVLRRLSVLPLEPPADREYARIRHELVSAGKPIGPVDLLIAAHALSLDLTLVTANVGEFSRVPGLRVENWLD